MNIHPFITQVIHYLFKQILLVALILGAVTLASFAITGGFSFIALSERLFWVAVFFFFVGGTVALANVVSSRGMKFPFYFRKPEEAKNYMDSMPYHREQAEKRLDVGIQLFFIGLTVFGFSALVEILSR